jgi:hypothetical protein
MSASTLSPRSSSSSSGAPRRTDDGIIPAFLLAENLQVSFGRLLPPGLDRSGGQTSSKGTSRSLPNPPPSYHDRPLIYYGSIPAM